MPRRNLDQTADMVLHVMNRGVRKLGLFDAPRDYDAFVRVLIQARERHRMRILAYCVMPNHFHLVVFPRKNGDLPKFMEWFQGTHSKRWHKHRGSPGTGAVYQGRYRAFPVHTDEHFLTVCRYVERNPVRARLVPRVQDWPWSSGTSCRRISNFGFLDDWPVPRPPTWDAYVNVPDRSGSLDAIRTCVARGIAFGPTEWADHVDARLETRGRHRPGKPPA